MDPITQIVVLVWVGCAAYAIWSFVFALTSDPEETAVAMREAFAPVPTVMKVILIAFIVVVITMLAPVLVATRLINSRKTEGE